MSVDSPGVRGSSEEGRQGESGGVRQVSVHRRLLGGRVFGLSEQRLRGGTAAVRVAGVRGGRRRTDLGLKQRRERGGRVMKLLTQSHIYKERN